MYPDREVLLLDKITIYSSDKSHSVTLPRVRDIEVGAEEESKTVTMASGKTVKDILGYRAKVTAVWDWIPADLVTELLNLLKTGAFLWVEYPAPSGNGAGFFSIEYPTLSVFCYKNSVPVWHDMTLSMTAQEVTAT
nr:MAG TPA_asm: hypothetical protein [Caudoviricetes sp.]